MSTSQRTRRQRQPAPPMPPSNPKAMPPSARDVYNKMKEEDEKKKMEAEKKVSKFTSSGAAALGVGVIILIIWIALGIFAFWTSLWCAGFRSGTVSEKLIGFVIAFLFGPFYWLYFYFMKDYCKKVTA